MYRVIVYTCGAIGVVMLARIITDMAAVVVARRAPALLPACADALETGRHIPVEVLGAVPGRRLPFACPACGDVVDYVSWRLAGGEGFHPDVSPAGCTGYWDPRPAPGSLQHDGDTCPMHEVT